MSKFISLAHKLVQKYRKRGIPQAAESSYIAGNVKIYNRRNIVLGDRATIKAGAWIMNTRAKFIMKKWSGAAFGLTVVTGSHMQVPGMKKFEVTDTIKNKLDTKHEFDRDIIVEEEVWVGSKTTLLIGTKLGRGSIVGSGSVVRMDVPPYAIIEGNPAKIVGFRFKLQDIFKHEEALYPEEERLPRELIEEHYYSFYGHPKKAECLPGHTFTLNDYKETYQRVLNIAPQQAESAKYRLTKGWDSVGHMTLIVEMERTFGVSLSPEDFLQFHDYKKGLDILREKGVTFEEEKEQTFPEAFFDFSSFQKNVAVQTEDKSYTYQDLDAFAAEMAKILTPRKVAFLLAKNSTGSITCYVGCLKNHIPVAVLDAHKDADFIGNIIKQYHPEYLILPTEDSDKYSGEVIGTVLDYTIKHLENTTYAVSNELSLMLTTSGSTGSPKFVRLTTKNIQSNAESIARYLKLNAKERPITSLPMYYSYGISIINSHFIVGATLILTEESVVSPNFWTMAKEQKATSVSGVPYTYDMFRQMRVMEMDLPYLKTFTQAGGKMNKGNVAYFAEKCKASGKELIVMYGQTEASPRISYLPFEKAQEKSDSIGIAIPGVTLSIGEDQELVCQGSNVFMGYAESYEDLGKGDENNGVLHTGDLAKVDEDGYFYITGRKKRFVKVYGNRVGLDELENLITPVFGKVVCVGKDDHVTIFTEEKTGLDVEKLTAFISEKTKINQMAFEVKIVEAFPYSETGKILYGKLNID